MHDDLLSDFRGGNGHDSGVADPAKVAIKVAVSTAAANWVMTFTPGHARLRCVNRRGRRTFA
jgi:hypothetical protein